MSTTDPREVIRGALVGGYVEWESDRRLADESPDEWCVECLTRPAAAINAARIAVASLSAAGKTLLPPGPDLLCAEPDHAQCGDRCCRRCHVRNVVWFTDSALWNRVEPDDGVLCVRCFIADAEAAGVGAQGAWWLLPEFGQYALALLPPGGEPEWCVEIDGITFPPTTEAEARELISHDPDHRRLKRRETGPWTVVTEEESADAEH